ncbi:MAG TPA: hypothetical protein VFS05_08785, partial [Gemmatimonadaceae bacterium]|nr:hypothetical protein [Gemmatimonadaceae bacterium]
AAARRSGDAAAAGRGDVDVGGGPPALTPLAGARTRALAWLAAGLLMGATVAIRPLTGVAIGAALALWILLRRRRSLRELLALGGLIAAGAVLPIAALLAYNAATTGRPLTFGYTAVHGHLHDLGFGRRGFRLHGGSWSWHEAAQRFTPGAAARRLAQQSWDIAVRLVPGFLLLPLLWLALARGAAVRWRMVAPFALLPAAYFFYFFTTSRFYSELFPFALVGVAILVAELGARRWRSTGAPLAVLLVAASGAGILAWGGGRQERARDVVLPAAAAVDSARARHGRVLVFIDEEQPEWYLFRRLSLFNDGFDGDVVVARDLGPANAALQRRLPGHVPLRGTWRGARSPLVLTELRSATAAPSPESSGAAVP